jgi:TonB family protein
MKFLFTAMLFLTTAGLAFPQTTTYYKDEFLNKQVIEKKGKFRKVETALENGSVNVKTYQVKANVLLRESNFSNGKPAGIWVRYNPDGSIQSKRNLNKVVYSTKEIKDIFNNAVSLSNPLHYQKTEYPDGETEMMKFMAHQIRYPAESLNASSSGTVYIRFTIDDTGKATPHSIYKGVDAFIDYEAWSLIENMPKWIPAKMNGQPIASYYTLPVRFAIK